jgi:hypothetical protein
VLLALPGVLGWYSGGYFLDDAAPATLAVVAMLLVIAVAGGAWTRGSSRWWWPAVGAIAAYAAWTALSIHWAPNQQLAWVETDRAILYAAALVAVPLLLSRDLAARLPWLLLVSVAGPVLATVPLLLRLADHRADYFLDGRMLGTVGYFNGEGAFLVMPAALALTSAASRRFPWPVRGACVAGMALLGATAILPQSRGAVLATALVTLLLLALSPWRLRILPPLAVAGGCVALAAHACLAVYNTRDRHDHVTHAATAHAAHVVLLVAGLGLVAGCAWAWIDARLAGAARAQHLGAVCGRAVLVLVVACALGVVVAKHGAVGDRVSDAWSSFRDPHQLTTHGSQSRFSSVANNGRVELWRTAIEGWKTHRVRGVGAGNYADSYYRFRSRPEGYVKQPHSLVLEALSERGVVGLALLGSFLLLVLGSGAWAVRGRPVEERALTVALLATFVQWLAQSQLDWFWQLPAVTLLPVVCAGLLVTRAASATTSAQLRLPERAALGLLAAVSVVSVGLPWMSSRSLDAGDRLLPTRPAQAASWYRRADSLDSLDPLVAQRRAVAAERTGHRSEADRWRDEYVARAPVSWPTWAWVADYELRAGRAARATAAVRRVEDLDPIGNYLPKRCAGRYHGERLRVVACHPSKVAERA